MRGQCRQDCPQAGTRTAEVSDSRGTRPQPQRLRRWLVQRFCVTSNRQRMICLASTVQRKSQSRFQGRHDRLNSRLPRAKLARYLRCAGLDHHPIRNGGVLDDDHNTVLDDEAQGFPVGLLHVVAGSQSGHGVRYGRFCRQWLCGSSCAPPRRGEWCRAQRVPPVGQAIRSSPRPSRAPARSHSRFRCASAGQ